MESKFQFRNSTYCRFNFIYLSSCCFIIYSTIFVKINGVNITTPSTGVNFPNSSNATIRKGAHGAFGELRFNFSSNLLHAGDNVISFTVRKSGGDIQYDYIRLESPLLAPVATKLPSQLDANTLVYPNPFVETLHLKLDAKPSNASVQISTMDGKIVFEAQFVFPTSIINLNLSQLKSGIYTLKLSLDKSDTFYKILKR